MRRGPIVGPRPLERPARIDRRELLRRGLVLGAGIAAARVLRAPTARADGPRVVIVGAGLAGLACAHRLWQGGIAPVVYEARDRVGGRVMTIRTLEQGQYAEAGGQTIDSRETAIRSLVAELGLSLLDLDDAWPSGDEVYRFRGARRGWGRISGGLARAEDVAARHYRQLGWPVTYRSARAGAERWDDWTVAEWIDEYVPGGLGGIPGRYVRALFEADYGGPAGRASAIHVIADLGGSFWGGGYDERWTIAGGNDQLPAALEAALPGGTVRRGAALQALRRNLDGTLTCAFSTGDVIADRVVLALPFATLRDVDLSAAGFRRRKRRAIRELGRGQNVKMVLQFGSQPWRPDTGESWSDTRLVTTWPGHPGQPGTDGVLIVLGGARLAEGAGDVVHGVAPEAVTAGALDAIDKIFPGTAAALLPGQAYLHRWLADPWARGSYAYCRPGGFTGFAGIEREPEGHVHFAGEHTAPYRARGTMNGAVMSGFRAANEVLAALS